MTKQNTEMVIQRELIKWLQITHPEIEYIFRKNEGFKDIITAQLDKLAGLSAGVPDLQLLIIHANITYILELELKKKKGILSMNQKAWHGKFVATSNRSLVTAYGFIDAKEKITNWLQSLPC